MSILSDIIKIKDNDSFAESLLALILFISPGILSFFYFERDLFVNLDILRILALSISLMTPFLLMSTVAYSFSGDGKHKDGFYKEIVSGIVLTSTIFYIALVLGFIFGWTLMHFLIGVTIAHGVLLLINLPGVRKKIVGKEGKQ